MKPGGEDLLKQFNRGIDYAQNTFNIAEGVTSFAPTLLFKGIVIDVNFQVSKSTVGASILPPFSVYAKIIGMDESSSTPLEETERTYYPPFFPMHNLCIPEVGEEVLIFKETPEPSSAGYYVGRVNDSTPLNMSYARDYVGINDPETRNSFRYGFNFDVRQLREKFSYQSPSLETANISIPLTFGDVVQQGRSKTYVRQSFNKNNKKGVLEQGIRLDGQLSPVEIKNQFHYYGPNDGVSYNGNGKSNTDTYVYKDPETGEISEQQDINGNVYAVSNNEMLKINQDPSIGETSTKNIHFIDSSIKRLGNYNYQSLDVGEQNNKIEGEDKAMIVNIADEIYNISSRDVSGALFRQVLGEKLVLQQRQTYNMIDKVLQTVSGFAESTQILLDAFLEHDHALPKIELNLEKTIEVKDRFRTPPRLQQQPNLNVNLPNTTIMVTGPDGLPEPVVVPGGKVSIPQPPKMVSKGRFETKVRKQEINFEAIIGGAENPRFTAPVQTDKQTPQSNPLPGAPPQSMEKTELGMKTGKVDEGLENIINSFQQQQEKLVQLSTQISKILSKNQFVN